jgi:hypothetical protein
VLPVVPVEESAGLGLDLGKMAGSSWAKPEDVASLQRALSSYLNSSWGAYMRPPLGQDMAWSTVNFA